MEKFTLRTRLHIDATSHNGLEGASMSIECIRACNECAIACEICLNEMIGEESPDDCPRCCRECLEICTLCARAIARESMFVAEYCRLCAQICQWCAEQCAQHKHVDCQRCAERCRWCARKCLKMAA